MVSAVQVESKLCGISVKLEWSIATDSGGSSFSDFSIKRINHSTGAGGPTPEDDRVDTIK